MGHFSRYLVPGAKRVQVSNTVEVEIPQVAAGDIKNGAALLFEPCDADSAVQQFRFATPEPGDKIAASLIAAGTDDAPGSDGYQRGGECVELCIMPGCWFPKVQLWACGDGGEADHGGRGNQKWDVQSVKGGYKLEVRGSPEGAGGGEVKGCLTAVKAEGWAVDLDAGLEVIAAQLAPCLSDGTSNQTFLLGGDGEGESLLESSFTVGTADAKLCLAPQIPKLPHFDAVGFHNPDGTVAVVAMNTNDDPVEFTLKDEALGLAAKHSLPAHAIHTYRWQSGPPADAIFIFAQNGDTLLHAAPGHAPVEKAAMGPAVAAAAGRLTPAMAAARSVGVAAAAAPVATSGAAMTPPELLVETVAGDKPGEGPTLEAPPPARASWIAVCAGGAVALAVALRRRSFGGAVNNGRTSRQYIAL
mmetsp:Transcript_13016/g.42972  ORF Transcript_13016/g.42972 Transcript_13016/m.42972 type:complete len:415 (-) Transcript_13016:268-1512(-)